MTGRSTARSVRILALAATAALLLAGCGGGPSASPSSAVAIATPAPPTADELAAIKFRTENSLQADLEHVRAVAADPSAGTEFGVPLLPAESSELMSRSNNVEDIITIVLAEAAKAPGDFCGQYIDNAREGALTSLWKANGLVHELSIRGQVRPNAPIAFGTCRFSEPEQEAAMNGIRSIDSDWMRREIPAVLRGYGFDIKRDVLGMQISSAVADAADIVRRHYETALRLPAGMLVVTSDGTGSVLKPWGKVKVTIIDAAGNRVRDPNGTLMLVSLEAPSPDMECGGGDVGYGVGTGGVGELPCQVGEWTIGVVSEWHQDTGWEVHGKARVTVRDGETTSVTITVRNLPSP